MFYQELYEKPSDFTDCLCVRLMHTLIFSFMLSEHSTETNYVLYSIQLNCQMAKNLVLHICELSRIVSLHSVNVLVHAVLVQLSNDFMVQWGPTGCGFLFRYTR